MKYRLNTILIFSVLSTLGCASIQDLQYKSTHCIQAHAASAFAPRCRHFNDDYKCGFSQGYYDYSLNRSCKPPTIPPKEYWKAKYENPRGQQQIEAWYRGYEMGMLASEQDCGNCWHRLHPRGLLMSESPSAYPTNATVPATQQSDAPHPSGTVPESIPVPIPVPRQDTGFFDAPTIEIQAAAYQEQSVVSVETTQSPEPSRLLEPAQNVLRKPLFSPPPLPR